MTLTREREPAAGILRAMAADADVCGELVRAAMTHSPEVARLGEAESCRHVAALVTAAGDWFTDVGRLGEHDLAAALLLGADRAGQGVPMTALLRGVQAALTRAAELTVERCRSAGVPDGSLLKAVLLLKEYGDAVERQVISGYRAVELAAPPPTAAETRTALLRRLLVTGPPPTADELTATGLRPGGTYHCLVAATTAPTPGGAVGGVFGGAVAVPGAVGGVFGVIDGHTVGLCPRAPGDTWPAAGPLAVTAPAAPLDGLRPAYRLCLRALDIAGRHGLRGPHDLTAFAAEIALDGQPLLGTWLSDRLLGSLDHTDGFHRQLALTAVTFLDHGRRLDRTAASLFTHPNTVRYRLGRLHRITGESLTDTPPEPLSTLHWWWALTTWLRKCPELPDDVASRGGKLAKTWSESGRQA
ncbi:PucR family transcriptional regulator [Streptomyces paludis]|uniref:PucR family transcriptional regulator n=1 Tax=Streptomyces paludis TaxID=2282738 RepID=A0A345HIV8_9ACTN|nr:helix-turn-helix domain-containing protein [Streptomyces paludis]AXG76632.1 PucR family transcriptional regulator [Streptomyces paludis]